VITADQYAKEAESSRAQVGRRALEEGPRTQAHIEKHWRDRVVGEAGQQLAGPGGQRGEQRQSARSTG